MKPHYIALTVLALIFSRGTGEEKVAPTVLFDGSSLEAFDFEEGGWVIESDGAVTCRMKEVVDKKGKPKVQGMGNLWTKEEYGDFELTLSYKLSEGANSGVFYRSTREDPVHHGHEVQLMDNVGFQKTHGEKDERKLNGSFYEGKGPSAHPANPVGQWDTLKLRAVGPRIVCHINGVEVFDVDVNDWPEVGKNPDGTDNKFKVAIKDKPRKGYIGFQNHGQVVSFKEIKIQSLD
ncbi:MAG: DUF1080 domain-containing protein [Verrucomicrobiales bacterium]|nr:DUF1080 domain-containing protein [Verrucomicrobiales bacterium]